MHYRPVEERKPISPYQQQLKIYTYIDGKGRAFAQSRIQLVNMQSARAGKIILQLSQYTDCFKQKSPMVNRSRGKYELGVGYISGLKVSPQRIAY